jgi:membrane protein
VVPARRPGPLARPIAWPARFGRDWFIGFIGLQGFADQLIRIFHLTGTAAATVRQAFAPPGAVESQVSAIGALLLVVSALSFTRALQRLYELAWGETSLGVRAAKFGLIWLALVVATLTVRPILLGAFHGVTKVVLTMVTSGLLWLVTPYVLLGRRVDWRRLWPTAALTRRGDAPSPARPRG